MRGNRRTGREICLQSLYLQDNCKLPTENAWSAAISASQESDLEFAKQLFEGIESRKGEIDEIIQRYCHNWKMERMTSVDRNILRIAAYEFLATPETPVKVIINEAVEIAKKFSTEESGKFVNGILDKLKAERPA